MTAASTDAPSPIALLRAATATAHERVDAAFGTLGLEDRDRYARFLRAHALALPAAEAAMRPLSFARTLTPRTPLLARDVADMGGDMPTPLDFAATDEAAAWGALYVVEGSRLGGVMLARMVPEGLPKRYLAAAHPPGQWRAIREAVDAAAPAGDPAWRERLVAGALACFALYERAATGERG